MNLLLKIFYLLRMRNLHIWCTWLFRAIIFVAIYTYLFLQFMWGFRNLYSDRSAFNWRAMWNILAWISNFIIRLYSVVRPIAIFFVSHKFLRFRNLVSYNRKLIFFCWLVQNLSIFIDLLWDLFKWTQYSYILIDNFFLFLFTLTSLNFSQLLIYLCHIDLRVFVENQI